MTPASAAEPDALGERHGQLGQHLARVARRRSWRPRSGRCPPARGPSRSPRSRRRARRGPPRPAAGRRCVDAMPARRGRRARRAPLGHLGIGVGAARDHQRAGAGAPEEERVLDDEARLEVRVMGELLAPCRRRPRRRCAGWSCAGDRPPARRRCASYATPAVSSPRPSTLGARPTPTRISSTSSARGRSPRVHVQRLAARAPLHPARCLRPARGARRRAPARRCTSPAASGSSRPRSCAAASSDGAPARRSRAKAWASSQPMGPPPITASRRGSAVSENTVSLVR